MALGFRYLTFQEPAAVYPPSPEAAALSDPSEVRPRMARAGGGSLRPNAALVYGLFDLHGSDTFILSRTVDLLSIPQDQTEPARGRNPHLPRRSHHPHIPGVRLLGVQRVAGPPASGILGSPSARGAFAVYARGGSLPPAFLAPCWRLLPEGRGLAALRNMDAEALRATAIIENSAAARGPLGASTAVGCEGTGAAAVLSYQPERVAIETESAVPSVLVLTDAWYPGWEALVDGREEPVLVADHALRGLTVRDGSSPARSSP